MASNPMAIRDWDRAVRSLVRTGPLKKLGSHLYGQATSLIERLQDVFLTTHRRPKRARNIGNISSVSPSRRTAIAMQGPIVAADDFTCETVRLYRKMFPETCLIVSTWEDSDPALVASIRAEGADLVLSQKPAYAGESNVNLQIVSTIGGVRRAKELGVDYVLKTRSDQRIYAVNTMAYLLALVRSFPLSEPTTQKERLVSISLDTFKYRPYSVSDMFLFGHIDDMLLYWDVPLDLRTDFPRSGTIATWTAAEICEVYFVTHFLKKVGHQPKFTIADSWDVYRKHFCIIDQQSVDLFWIKSRSKEYGGLRYDGIHTDEELTFREWLLLHAQAYDPSTVPEAALGKTFGSAL
jgi:hypothetical protein